MVFGAPTGAQLPDARRGRVGRRRVDGVLPARRVRGAGAQGMGDHLPRRDQSLDRGAAHLLLSDHPALHRPPELERQPDRAAVRHQGHHGRARARALPRGDHDARGAKPQNGTPRPPGRAHDRGGVRVQRKERARCDDPPHPGHRTAGRPHTRAGRRPGRGGGPLALPGVSRIARRRHRRGARQGDPRRAPGRPRAAVSRRSCAPRCSCPARARSRTSWPT